MHFLIYILIRPLLLSMSILSFNFIYSNDIDNMGYFIRKDGEKEIMYVNKKNNPKGCDTNIVCKEYVFKSHVRILESNQIYYYDYNLKKKLVWTSKIDSIKILTRLETNCFDFINIKNSMTIDSLKHFNIYVDMQDNYPLSCNLNRIIASNDKYLLTQNFRGRQLFMYIRNKQDNSIIEKLYYHFSEYNNNKHEEYESVLELINKYFPDCEYLRNEVLRIKSKNMNIKKDDYVMDVFYFINNYICK